MSYLRRYNADTVLVVLNISKSKRQATFDLAAQGHASATANVMLATTGTSANQGAIKTVTLEPYGVFIAELTKISIAILRSGATQHMRIQAYLRLRDRSFSSDITHKLIIGF